MFYKTYLQPEGTEIPKATLTRWENQPRSSSSSSTQGESQPMVSNLQL